MKILLLILLSVGAFALFTPLASAHCPLCTGATIAGVGITRSLGLDDSLIGIFVGGMIASTALWLNNIFNKKGIKGNNKLRITSLIVATFILTLWTLYYAGLFGLGNTERIFGIERLVFGSLSGVFISLLAIKLSSYIKENNKGKTLFNYQTMILTLGGLLVNAGLFWLIL